MTTGIVDGGTCNLDSVVRAVHECGGEPIVVTRPELLTEVSRIILPGVGHFKHGMQQLREKGLANALVHEVVEKGIPLLGICLGMQFLSTTSSEGGETAGLNLIPGAVKRLTPRDASIRVPHVGWNDVHLRRSCPLFDGITDGSDFYFVHSYHFQPAEPTDTVAETDYGGGFAAAVNRGHVFGVQFHPEKSQRMGFRLLQNFLAL